MIILLVMLVEYLIWHVLLLTYLPTLPVCVCDRERGGRKRGRVRAQREGGRRERERGGREGGREREREREREEGGREGEREDSTDGDGIELVLFCRPLTFHPSMSAKSLQPSSQFAL